jgi:hypothetical protein
MGPNVKKLTIQKMTIDTLPPGSKLADAISALTNPNLLSNNFKKAHYWVIEAIKLIRTGAEPNPWKNANDEEIALELLRRVEAKKRK